MYIFFKIDFSDSQSLERGSTSMPLDCLIVVTAKIPNGIPCYRDDSEIHSQGAGVCAHLHVPKQHCVFGGLLTLLWLYYLQVNHLFQKHPEFSECVLSNVQLCDPMDYNPPSSSVHGISQAKYWSGLPFPTPGDLPNQGIKSTSPALQADSLSTVPPGKSALLSGMPF